MLIINNIRKNIKNGDIRMMIEKQLYCETRLESLEKTK